MGSRRSFQLSFVITSTLILASAPQGLAQGPGGDEALKRFLREAPPQWEEYVRRSKELQGVLAVSIQNARSQDNTQFESRTEYKTNGKGAILIASVKGSSNGKVEREEEEVFGLNPRYAFNLSHKTPGSPWVLAKFFDRSRSADLGRVATQVESYLTAITSGVRLDGELLAEMVRKSEFRIGSCRSVQREGNELVEVAFTYSKMDGKWKRNLNGKLFLDPNRYWCWRSGEVRAVSEGFSSGTLKFEGTQSANDGDSPPLSRVWESDGDWTSSKGEWSNQQRIRYEATLNRPSRLPADTDFTLSAFDLPEPFGVVWKKQTPTYVWLLVAAGTCAVLAVGFRYLARKRAVNSGA